MTLILAAGTLAASIATALRYRLRFEEAIDLTPSEHWPEPIFSTEPEPDAGPVLITVEYTVEPPRAEILSRRCCARTQRLRDGAYRWGLYNDAAAPRRFVETSLWSNRGRNICVSMDVLPSRIGLPRRLRAHFTLAPRRRSFHI